MINIIKFEPELLHIIVHYFKQKIFKITVSIWSLDLKSIEIREILNRCNFEDNDFQSTDQRSLEARILPL